MSLERVNQLFETNPDISVIRGTLGEIVVIAHEDTGKENGRVYVTTARVAPESDERDVYVSFQPRKESEEGEPVHLKMEEEEGGVVVKVRGHNPIITPEEIIRRARVGMRIAEGIDGLTERDANKIPYNKFFDYSGRLPLLNRQDVASARLEMPIIRIQDS